VRDTAVRERRPPEDTGTALISGRYRPLRPLGSGGSGSVWLARDEHAGRDVALKVVRREGKAASRAEREVEAAGRLRHPSCLRALAIDRDDEHVYVAYEYVRGHTLRQALVGGALDDAGAVEAAAQILEGLAHAHAKGIVHRDVKPANVMVADSERLRITLLDFGLAQVEEADTLTAHGDVPGTLSYVSPERLDGSAATPAADVWATGVVLWESLVGRHPFTAASPVDTVRRIQAGAEPLGALRPDLPADLCALVDRMLHADPRRRPAARRLPNALRDAFEARSRRPRPAVSLASLRERALHGGLAAAFAAASLFLLPFFPTGWPLLLGALAGVAALRSPRAGLALALAAPVLPLGNVALGLALAWIGLAAGWLAAFWRAPTSAFLFLAGPALAPLGLVGGVPLVALRVGDRARQAATAAAAVLAAGAFAALAGGPFPLGDGFPDSLDFAETTRPDTAAGVLATALTAHAGLLLLAAVCAAATLAVEPARRRGLWGIAAWGSAFLAAAVLSTDAAGGEARVLLVAPGIWAATLWLGAERLRTRR